MSQLEFQAFLATKETKALTLEPRYSSWRNLPLLLESAADEIKDIKDVFEAAFGEGLRGSALLDQVRRDSPGQKRQEEGTAARLAKSRSDWVWPPGGWSLAERGRRRPRGRRSTGQIIPGQDFLRKRHLAEVMLASEGARCTWRFGDYSSPGGTRGITSGLTYANVRGFTPHPPSPPCQAV